MQSSSLALAFAGLLAMTVTGYVFANPTGAQQASSPEAADNSGQNHGMPGFGDLDKKHRGYLSRSDIPKDVEGLKPLRAHFNEADMDNNGRLSPAEYASYVQNQTPESEKSPGRN